MSVFEQPHIVRHHSDDQVRFVAITHPMVLDQGTEVGATHVDVVRRPILNRCTCVRGRSGARDHHPTISQEALERTWQDAELMSIGPTANPDRQRMQLIEPTGPCVVQQLPCPRGTGRSPWAGSQVLIAMNGVEVDLQSVTEPLGPDLPRRHQTRDLHARDPEQLGCLLSADPHAGHSTSKYVMIITCWEPTGSDGRTLRSAVMRGPKRQDWAIVRRDCRLVASRTGQVVGKTRGPGQQPSA